MSVLYCCDGCPRRKVGTFRENAWEPPPGWKTFTLEDWEAHSCSEACHSSIKENVTHDPTPTTGSVRLPT